MATPKKPATRKTKKPTNRSKAADKKRQVSAKVPRPQISRQSLQKYALPFLAALIVVLAGIFWYYRIYTDPQRVFWGMIENNLSTSSFVKESSQDSGSFNSQEITLVSFQPELAVHNVRDITDNTQQQPTRIKLEAIGTPDADYQHYLVIDRPAAEGKAKPDYSKVYDMWLKSQNEDAQLINSNLFGPLLFGYLPETLRQSVVSDLKKAYDVSEAPRKINLNGRRTYSYDVEVKLAEYAAAAQKYAKALGLAVADQIDPASYSEDDKIRVTVYIDALSRQIRKIEYQSSNTTESYTRYGIRKGVAPPNKTVSPEEFQNAVNSVSE